MNQEQANDDDMIVVNSLPDFLQHFLPWHQRQVKQVQHLLNVPDGMEVKVDEDTITLTGDVMKAFKIGIELSLSAFAQLPFGATFDKDKMH